MNPSSETILPSHGRLCIVLAALMWSTSGAFTKVLTKDTPMELHIPTITPQQIAFFRVFFAGLVLLPTLRRRDFSFRPMMLVMLASFAYMNDRFVKALALGTAANAILLQYTAPMWMFLASVWWLGEKADRRSFAALLVALCGIAVIVFGGWQQDNLDVVGLGLESGVGYAGVLICLRVLRDRSSRWLTVWNLLGSALVAFPFIYGSPLPTLGQGIVLFFYGAAQMGIPYWLMARGLRTVTAQEAGIITLLEPLLNPVWAYLVSGEQPSGFTLAGGAFILGALVWRYWPSTVPLSDASEKRVGNEEQTE